jgi:hypothetical protein
LTIRSEINSAPGGSAVLAKLCDIGRDLQTRREKLDAPVATTSELSASQLRGKAETLRRAGLMSWLAVRAPIGGQWQREPLLNHRRQKTSEPSVPASRSHP